MYVRVTAVEIPIEGIDAAIRAYQRNVISRFRQQKGFVSATILVDREHGRALALVYYDSKEVLASSEVLMQIMRGSSVRGAGGEITAVDYYEVAMHVEGAADSP